MKVIKFIIKINYINIKVKQKYFIYRVMLTCALGALEHKIRTKKSNFMLEIVNSF